MSTPTTFLLIRHGHTDADGKLLCGWHDVPLSSTGRQQALELCRRLERQRSIISTIYTSTSIRARSTADIIAGGHAALAPEEGLREIHCGDCEGMPLQDVQTRFADLWRRNVSHDPHFRWPNGESYIAFRARVIQTLNRIAIRHSGNRVWLVTHSGVISQVVGIVQSLHSGYWQANRPDHATITEVTWNGTGPASVVRFSDTLQYLASGEDPVGAAKRVHPVTNRP